MTFKNQASSARVTRRGIVTAFAATAISAAPAQAGIFGFLRGGGDTRRIKMYSGRTGESIDMIYYVNGRYIDEAVREISYFMRDWRDNEAIKIDKRALDVMAAAHNLLDVDEPYLMLSGYRTPRTNFSPTTEPMEPPMKRNSNALATIGFCLSRPLMTTSASCSPVLFCAWDSRSR